VWNTPVIERTRVCALLTVTLLLAPCALAETPSTSAAAAIGTNVFPAAPQRDLVVRTCAACHAPEIVVAKRHTADEWDDIIAKMVDRGAVANESEQQQILEYLAKFFGPA
jgi:cytochrome c5